MIMTLKETDPVLRDAKRKMESKCSNLQVLLVNLKIKLFNLHQYNQALKSIQDVCAVTLGVKQVDLFNLYQYPSQVHHHQFVNNTIICVHNTNIKIPQEAAAVAEHALVDQWGVTAMNHKHGVS